MADYLLAAHIRVTGGDAAVAELRKVDQAMGQVGKTSGSQAGSGMTAGLKEAEGQASRLSGAVDRVLTSLVRMGTYTGITAVAAGFYQMASGVLDFDQAMTESLAIQGNVTGRMRGQMEDLAESISIHLGMAPKEAAEGFYYLASAGLNVQQQMAALPQVAAFAKAGMMDLEQATELSYDALSALGQKVSDPQKQLANLTKLTDELTVAAIASQGTVEQFGEAIANKAGASMKTFGIPMEQGIALLEVFADQGIKGKVAGERFSMVIRDLALKSLLHADAWKKVGVEVYNAQGGFNPLVDIMSQLDKNLGGMDIETRTLALRDMGFTMRDVQTVLALIGTSDSMRNFAKDLENAGGAAQRVADKQMESLRSKLDQVKAATIVFAIEGWEKLQTVGDWLGQTFAPAIDAVLDAGGKMGAGLKPLAEVLAHMAVGAAAGGLKGVATALDAVFSTIASHQGLAEGIGAALGGMIVLPQLGRFVDYLGGPLVRAIGDAQWAFSGFLQNFRAANLATSSGALDAIAGAFRGIGSALATLAVPAGFAAIGLGIYGVVSDFQKGGKAADDFWTKVQGRHDMNSTRGISDSLDEVRAKFQENEQWMSDNAGSWWEGFKRRGGSALDSLTPGFFNYKHNVIELAGEQQNLQKILAEGDQKWVNNATGMGILGQAFGGARVHVAELAAALKGSGAELDVAKVGEFANRLEHMSITAGIAKVPTGQLNQTMRELADTMGIDMSGPWEDWVPTLAEAYVKLQQVREVAGDLGGSMAEGTGGKPTGMEEALLALEDTATNVEDKLKSLQTVMGGMDKGAMGAFVGAADWEESLEGLAGALQKNKDSGHEFFSLLNQSGRDARRAFDETGDAALTMAAKIAGQDEAAGGGVQAGVAHLQGYADQIRDVMRSVGVAEPEIESYIAMLGLTPPQIETLIKAVMTGEDPKKVKDDLTNLDGTTAGAEFMLEAKGLYEALSGMQQLQGQKWHADVAIGTPGIDEAIGGVFDLASPRTQTTTVDTPNKDQKSGELDAVADKERVAGVPVDTPNKDQKSGELDAVASKSRTATIGVQVNDGPGWNALNAFEGARRTSYVDIVTTYTSVVAQGPDPGLNRAAEGGIYSFAQGGGFRMKERHVAQIAPAGSWRLWAEPETGGEAYIPLAQSKRNQSTAIWEEVGRRFGLGGGNSTAVTMAPNINIKIDGAGHLNPEALAQAVRAEVVDATTQGFNRLMVELRSMA